MTNGDAFQRQFAILFGNHNEAEISRATADVADENEVADFDGGEASPWPPSRRVKGGLKVFEQRDMVVTGLFGSSPGQLACFFVEGSGHSEEHVLFRESQLPLLPRLAAVPYSAQVLQEL